MLFVQETMRVNDARKAEAEQSVLEGKGGADPKPTKRMLAQLKQQEHELEVQRANWKKADAMKAEAIAEYGEGACIHPNTG
jgi:hypothetical protein